MMKRKILHHLKFRLLYALTFSSFVLFSCSKTEDIKNRSPEKVVLLSPADQLTDVEVIKPSLEWQSATDPDGDAVFYDLYLDTEAVPQKKVIGDLKATSYKLQTDLDFNTTYYWRVTAHDGKGGSSESEVYEFTTREQSIQEAIVGKWTIEAVLNGGFPSDWSDCDKQSYFDFRADGSFSAVSYSDNPCKINNAVIGTYLIDGGWNIRFKADGEDDIAKINSISQNSLKLLAGDQLLVFKRVQ